MAQPYPDAGHLAGALQELAARSVNDQVRAAQRYRELLEQVATGELDAAAVRAQYDRLVQEQSAELARQVGELSIRFYQSILDLNRAYVDRLFDQLRVVRPPPDEDGRTAAAPPAPAPPIELGLRGRVGETVETSFVVENKRAEAADIAFLLSEFTGGEGEPFRVPLELDPPRFRLVGYGERAVALRLALTADLFAPGRRYRAEMLVRGNDDLVLRLVIDVDE
jgi:hypothetical protein